MPAALPLPWQSERARRTPDRRGRSSGPPPSRLLSWQPGSGASRRGTRWARLLPGKAAAPQGDQARSASQSGPAQQERNADHQREAQDIEQQAGGGVQRNHPPIERPGARRARRAGRLDGRPRSKLLYGLIPGVPVMGQAGGGPPEQDVIVDRRRPEPVAGEHHDREPADQDEQEWRRHPAVIRAMVSLWRRRSRGHRSTWPMRGGYLVGIGDATRQPSPAATHRLIIRTLEHRPRFFVVPANAVSPPNSAPVACRREHGESARSVYPGCHEQCKERDRQGCASPFCTRGGRTWRESL